MWIGEDKTTTTTTTTTTKAEEEINEIESQASRS